MRDAVFIGDDITALGFRLAGVHTLAPAQDQLADVIAQERSDCRIMILTAAMFDALPEKLSDELRNGRSPLLAIVPDARDTMPVPDLERQVQRALGIEV